MKLILIFVTETVAEKKVTFIPVSKKLSNRNFKLPGGYGNVP